MDKFAALFAHRGLSLDRLLSFCEVAEAGGLARATAGNDARSSLLSRQIRELESFFGAPLTRRRGKGIAPTAAGEELARVAQAHLQALDDFRRRCRAEPRALSIAAGNSVLEWLLLPALAQLDGKLPGVDFSLRSMQTREIGAHLARGSIDLGILRGDAAGAGLARRALRGYGYCLFVPRALAAGLTPRNLRRRLATLPLTTYVGGQFRSDIAAAAASAGWPLHFTLACSSMTQAARAVRSGAYAAVLPETAAADFDPAAVVKMALPFFRAYSRPLCLVWNARAADTRPLIMEAVEALAPLLASPRR